jgi:raffinose/stachyose/melibiose transport system permease protein
MPTTSVTAGRIANRPSRNGRRARGTIARRYGHLWFVLPGLLVFVAFAIYPTISAFLISLTDWTGMGDARHFVGVANYIEVLRSASFYRAAWHNLQFFLAILLVQHTLGLFLAVQLNARPRFMEVYRTILFLPVILSLVATGFIWTLMLSPNIGILNPALEAVGLGFLTRSWLDDTTWALPCIIAVQAWNHLGWAIVIYMSGLQDVPQELQEAAALDGANHWQRFWSVTFPLLAPSFTSVTIITFIQNFRVFDVVYVLAGPIGAPAGRTDVLGTLIYRSAFGASGVSSDDVRMSYAITVAVVVFLIMLTGLATLVYGLRRREIET